MWTSQGLCKVFIFFVMMSGALSLNPEAAKRSFKSLHSKDSKKNPPIKLIFPMPRFYPSDPLPKDINHEELKKKLGKDFDPRFTALTWKEVLLRKINDSRREQQFYRKLLVSTMPNGIRDLDFRMPGLKRNLGPKASRKLQLWLWKLTTCPVISKWKDNGVRFWPQYRNLGRCSRKLTCSFPRGMKCKKSKTKPVALLRWHCERPKERKPKRICTWRKFFVSVIIECACQCANKDKRD